MTYLALTVVLLAAWYTSFTFPLLGLVAGSLFYLQDYGLVLNSQQALWLVCVFCCIPAIGLLLASMLTSNIRHFANSSLVIFTSSLSCYALLQADVLLGLFKTLQHWQGGQPVVLLLASVSNRVFLCATVVALLIAGLQVLAELPFLLWYGRGSGRIFPYWQASRPIIAFIFIGLGFEVISSFWLKSFGF